MKHERKTLVQLFVPISLELLFFMLAGMIDTMMLSAVNDDAVGAVGTANTYIGMFIIIVLKCLHIYFGLCKQNAVFVS